MYEELGRCVLNDKAIKPSTCQDRPIEDGRLPLRFINGRYPAQQVESCEAVGLLGNFSGVTFGTSERLDLWMRVGGAENLVESLKDGNVIEVISDC
jgi:hypothetical protein